MRISLIFVLGLFHFSANAQWAGEIVTPTELPLVTAKTMDTLANKPIKKLNVNPKTKKVAEDIGLYLSETFKSQLAPAEGKAPACGTVELASYLRALRTKGEFDQCLYRVKKCGTKVQFADLVEASMCATSNYDHTQAEDLYTRATDSKWEKEENYDFAVFQFASYTFVSPQTNLTQKRLESSHWSTEEQKLAFALIEKLALGKTAHATDEQVDAFVAKMESHDSPMLKELAEVFSVVLLDLEDKNDEALNVLASKYSGWKNPLTWFDMAYSIFYQQDAANFQFAKSVYDGYRPYLHPMLRLPLEQNVFTYSEIEKDICRYQVSSGKSAEKLKRAKQDWAEGKMTSAQLRAIANELISKQPTADNLTLLGSLDLADGASAAATENFWKAHELCPYYNRAHWGLALLRRQKSQNSYPDKNSLEENMKAEVKRNPPLAEISKYILNWSTLSDVSRDSVAYGSRFWRMFIPVLEDGNKASYLKSVFELLSEAPGLSRLRDQRITYAGDNRLWDDVRGAGGDVVIADLIEVQQTPFGAYNLLGHEMTHQFHQYTQLNKPEAFACNEALYDAAKERKKFADAYAGTNMYEYFAQGVTYEMIPESAPPRFGLNRSWIVENDPDQMAFLKSISASNGDLNRITCPLTL